MRIALLGHAPVFGGSTDLFIQARDFFVRRGHTVQEIFGLGAEAPDPRAASAWVVPACAGGWRERIRGYLAMVKSFGPDLVYAISGRDEADLLRFLPYARVRHLSSLERHEFFDVPHTLRITRGFMEACTANTPDVMEQVARMARAPTFLLPYLFPEPAKEIDDVDPARLLTEGNPIEIAFVSRLERFQKRSHWLPEIIRICDGAGSNLRWHIYGDGPDSASLRQRLGGNPRVGFHGWVDRSSLYEELPQHDILFLCSRWEGLPVAMVEGMRCGLACVAADIPAGIRWTLRQGGGWLYDARSPRHAAAALLRAAGDRAGLLAKRREALFLAKKLFSSRLAEQQFLRLEASLQRLEFNGNVLDVARASRFRAIGLSTYLKRLVLRPKR